MNNRRLQLRAWLLAMHIYEKRLMPRIGRARNSFLKAAAAAYEEKGGIPTYVIEAHRSNIRTILDQHYQAVILYFGSMVLKAVKSRRIDKKAANNLFSSFMLEWVKTESLRKATMIAATDGDDVRKVIQTGIDAGEGVSAISSKIREVSGLTSYRAATVARTETHNAATFGSVETARASEEEYGIVLQKVWLATQDDRTRESHKAANNQTVGLNERFTVEGESMDRPGDSTASPDNVINCRCGLAYEEKV